MYILAGLWHNLVLPSINKNTEAHHEGLGLMMLAYFMLALLMAYVYSLIYRGKKPVIEGLRLGVVVGILWVLPHGLVMAGAHDTSIIYEFKNALWHVFEQGVGGMVIGLVYSKIGKSK